MTPIALTGQDAAGPGPAAPAGPAATADDTPHVVAAQDARLQANRAWEVDRAVMLEQSERRAWAMAAVGLALALLGTAAVFVQGPLRQFVEIPIVVDRLTGETTIEQRLSVESVPVLEALDKHNLARFVRVREGYSWMFLQRDFDQVGRMAVPAVFGDYSRQFEGDSALQKKLGAAQEWHIHIVSVRLAASERSPARAGRREATVTYDKHVRVQDRSLPDVTSRHVASVIYEYQPQVLMKERDRLDNPFGFVVLAYRSDPEINEIHAATAGARP